ncbi:hypothetical protein EMPG_17728 [Blastomyces silverae]|uniref:Uncharacterized protein n=1 Tax=Blastomyces silverae TaxID=2060906 RepID=A0A0H1B6R7_9EURO|nr:hypothetical protein EMPG_17728 [Blastomyces silverae]
MESGEAVGQRKLPLKLTEFWATLFCFHPTNFRRERSNDWILLDSSFPFWSKPEACYI